MIVNRHLKNLSDFWGNRTPEKEAIYDGVRRVTYSELAAETQHLASALSKLGIGKGDKILASIPNWHEFVLLVCATAKLGAVFVPCNVLYVGNEFKNFLHVIEPKAVFLSSEAQLDWLKDYDKTCTKISVRFSRAECMSFAELLEIGKNQPFNEAVIDPQGDLFVIMFTSGSEGRPKGVELSPNNLFCAAVNIAKRLRCGKEDVFLVPIPCCHMFGMVTGVVVPLYSGGRIVLMEQFNPKSALTLIEKEKVTVLYGVPTMFVEEIDEIKREPADVSTVRTGVIAGAACSENLLREIYSYLHCDIMVGYGSTETVSVSMTSFEDDLKTRGETVGRPFEGNQVKIVNQEGFTVEPGEIGELMCKGYGVMKGYYRMPEETQRAFDEEGWFRTGDLASVDSSGYIRILGRKNDLIIRGGYNICPAEVENVYYQHPDVQEVRVIGVPDRVLGEQIYVILKLRNDAWRSEGKVTPEYWKEFARGRIAKFKTPDKVFIVNEMPKLESGKTDKNALIRMLDMQRASVHTGY